MASRTRLLYLQRLSLANDVSSSEPHEPNPALPPDLDDFFAECDEHLAAAMQTLLALETRTQQADQPQADRYGLEELFRAFHSIKGLCAMVGLRPAEQLAHQMESYLGALRQGHLAFGVKGFAALVEGVSCLEQIIEAQRNAAPLPNSTSILAVFESLLVSAEPPSATAGPAADTGLSAGSETLPPEKLQIVAEALRSGRFAWWATFTPSPALAERQVNVNTVRTGLLRIGELVYSAPKVLAGGQIVFLFLVITMDENAIVAGQESDGLSYSAYVLPALKTSQSPADDQPEAARHASGSQSIHPTNVVRVGLGRLDELMRMVGDLVITRARFEQNLKQMIAQIPAAQWRALQENNSAFERQIRDLREGIMLTRLVPIRDTFARMQFIVRDLTREFDKDVRIQLSGGDTEVDKFIVERVMDPLLHLVRNAVSHGIEAAPERLAAGKPPEGLIALRARSDGQTIVIEVEDNGRGIDTEQILARARQLNLVPASGTLENTDVLEVLCTPGFSTRENVDRSSGRGVGMNVVKSTVEELGGKLSLHFERGKSTRFTIRLPLTLSIADALIFDIGDQTFALPQSAVQDVFEFEQDAISVLENNEIVIHRGGALPLVRLSVLFKLSARPGVKLYALIVGESRSAVGLVVDRLLGLNEIVIRPLTDPLVRVMGIAGVTELGDGRIALILDPITAIRAAGSKSREQNAAYAVSNDNARSAATIMGVSRGIQ